jgi:hypothetical protein
MEEVIEKISKLNLNIDSDTAMKIADQYFAFETMKFWVLAPLLFLLVGVLIYMIILLVKSMD